MTHPGIRALVLQNRHYSLEDAERFFLEHKMAGEAVAGTPGDLTRDIVRHCAIDLVVAAVSAAEAGRLSLFLQAVKLDNPRIEILLILLPEQLILLDTLPPGLIDDFLLAPLEVLEMSARLRRAVGRIEHGRLGARVAAEFPGAFPRTQAGPERQAWSTAPGSPISQGRPSAPAVSAAHAAYAAHAAPAAPAAQVAPRTQARPAAAAPAANRAPNQVPRGANGTQPAPARPVGRPGPVAPAQGPVRTTTGPARRRGGILRLFGRG